MRFCLLIHALERICTSVTPVAGARFVPWFEPRDNFDSTDSSLRSSLRGIRSGLGRI